MPILVTGAGGMVGSHMMERFYAEGEAAVGTYYHPTTDISELPKDIAMLPCDVRNQERVREIVSEYKPEKIYHLAAQSFPTVSWERPFETMETNVNGTVAVFEAVKAVRKLNPSYDPIVVVACSSAEYGYSLMERKEKRVLISEETALLPLHPYGVSKVAQDLLAFQYYQNDKIRCIRARIFNTTGTRKINDATSDFTRRAVDAERAGTYEIRVGNLDTRRAIMDQRDLVSALILLSEYGTPGEAYNISSERIFSMREILTIIETNIGRCLSVQVDSALLRPTDEPVIAGDVSKLKAATGWSQQIPMEQTISDMLDYWRTKSAAQVAEETQSV